MKLPFALLLAAVAAAPLSAQTTPHPKAAAHPAGAATAAAHGCADVPKLSPKIPVLPPGTPCAKPLYTITTVPNARLAYVSPLEGPDFHEMLGLDPVTFSLAYIDVKTGTGELAQPHKWYTIKYSGYLTDGTKFDSSDDHPGGEPFTFPYGQHRVIAGWDTGFGGMRIGGKRRLFIPWQLAYGPNGNPPTIPAKAELVFDVEFISQSDQEPAPKVPPAPPASATPPAGSAPTKPAPATQAAPSTGTQPESAPADKPKPPQ